MNRIGNQTAWVFSVMLLLSACEGKAQSAVAVHDPASHANTDASAAASMEAVKESADGQKRVEIINTKGAKIGAALLSQTAEGVKVQVEVTGVAPGKHGFHFHETAKCTAPDFKTAGEHFNPEGKQHGFENPHGYHAGDLPNLEIGSDGKGKAEFIDRKVTLEKNKANSLLKPGGTALIIHEAQDDYKTDPTGNSGARIACGAVL